MDFLPDFEVYVDGLLFLNVVYDEKKSVSVGPIGAAPHCCLKRELLGLLDDSTYGLLNGVVLVVQG